MDKSFFRLAHISDLHFSKPSYGPKQFFSKRWVGNLNFFLTRKQVFLTERLPSLLSVFKQLKIDGVVITGDLTTTSSKEEFILATEFINTLKQANLTVFAIPGNHDQYTRSAFKKKTFYDFIVNPPLKQPQSLDHYTLKEHGVFGAFLGNRLWIVGTDTAIATSLISSRGYFSPEIEGHLRNVLSLIPMDHEVVVANHFPLFNQETPLKALMRREAFKQLLSEFPNVKLFLHGHTHRHCVADLRGNQLPILLDSGSVSHRDTGSWNVIDFTSKGCSVSVFNWHSPAESEKNPPWKQIKQHTFTW